MKTLARPQWHTALSVVASTILIAVLVVNLRNVSSSISTLPLITMIFTVMSSVALYEIFLGLSSRKRDIAILIAVGVRKTPLGIVLLGKAFSYTSICYFLGLTLGYLLLIYNGLPVSAFHSLAVLSALVICGSALLAGVVGAFYAFHLNVPEVLRH